LKPRTALVLFFQDLRLADNPALFAACKTGKPLVLLYVHDTKSAGEWAPGGASLWWLQKSLQSLNESLKAYRQKLVVIHGDFISTVMSVAKQVGADSIYWNRSYEPYRIDLLKKLKNENIETHSFNGSLLMEPWEVSTQSGGPFKVFTPFWRTVQKLIYDTIQLQVPKINPAIHNIVGEDLSKWKEPFWSKGFHNWEVGEIGGQKRLDFFLKKRILDYTVTRDRPDLDGTSRLSPHLHFGELSPRQIWSAVASFKGSEPYLREIAWREFSYHLLFHFPKITDTNFNSRFDTFPWVENPEAFKLWSQGKTGVPIVDAGMRQLWHLGWMHNRVRMIVGSFLTKDLRVHWKWGAKWFWDTLLDADLANNSASWQWVAGTGADAAPYFRIFNPYLQGKKFDPDGTYVRTWVPELAHVKTDLLHGPTPIPGYYPPLVDHKIASQKALESFKST
jgi:deoxyribodipyrimidine photo-lyase